MSIHNGAKTVQNGLIFHYDMHDRKSWKGKPTSNYCYQRNPKYLKTSNNYTKHSYSTDTTFDKNHPGRISVPNATGGTLSTMVNTGVNSGNWSVTHHAYFAYDTELKRPVAIMNDADGQWKAHSFNTGYSLNDLGWSEGTTYSISWLSWTTRIDKAANAGVYYRRDADQIRGFHAGQSNSQSTAKNTKPFTWQRVYANFTVPAGMDLDYVLGIYCYGHHTGRGVVKMADLQWEPGEASHFVQENNITKPTRSSTQALLDLAGGHTVTVDNLTYNSDGSFEFVPNGEAVVTHAADLQPDPAYTTDFWVWADSSQDNLYPRLIDKSSMLVHISQTSPFTIAQNTSVGTLRQVAIGSAFAHSTWTHISTSYDGQVGKIYVNGEQVASTDWGSIETPTTSTSNMYIGGDSGTGRQFTGKIESVKYYNRALSADEVKSNFQALRGRYGV